MEQSRLGSLIEALANIAIGFGINLGANLVVLPWFGFNVSASQAFGIGVVFTVISLVRGYFIRRWFNAKLQRMSQAAAAALAK
jgi:hypothetical protein